MSTLISDHNICKITMKCSIILYYLPKNYIYFSLSSQEHYQAYVSVIPNVYMKKMGYRIRKLPILIYSILDELWLSYRSVLPKECLCLPYSLGFPGGSDGKESTLNAETHVQLLGQDDPLEKGMATSCKELTHWKGPWCWEGLGAGGEGDDRGWDGWMASLTRRAWVWVNSGSWWWTGRSGVLRFMESQKVRHYWATELNWTEPSLIFLPGEFHGQKSLASYPKSWTGLSN